MRAVAYATTPPRTAADAPGTETSEETTSPPVSDSATATVHPHAISRLTSSSADGSPDGRRAVLGIRHAVLRPRRAPRTSVMT